jgi:uncharacterized protein (DUF885 family)
VIQEKAAMSVIVSRRDLMLGAGAGALCSAMPAMALTPAVADAQLDKLLTAQFETLLRRAPVLASVMGIDTGDRAALRSQMPDWSPQARERARLVARSELRSLRGIRRSLLSEAGKLNYDIAEFQLASRDRFARYFPFHSEGFGHPAGPFAVTQFGGFYTAVPKFMDTQHPVDNQADADAYLARLRAVPALLAADTTLARDNAAMGVIAPRFILEQAIRQLTALRDGNGRDKTLVRSIAERSKEKGLNGYGERALVAWDGPIRAALGRQIDTLTALLPRATHAAGVGRLPGGAAYYAAVLKLHTTTDAAPNEIHRTGLEQVADLKARIEALLQAQGYRTGTVRERLVELKRAPGQVFADDDAGRAALLAYVNGRLEAIRPRLPQAFSRMPRSGFEIRRVPVEIEAGASLGSTQPGSLDGSRPAIFFINLRDTGDWPRYTLPTFVFHEAVPGHRFEGSLRQENENLPLYRQFVSATAYGEGWGLYAEQVADELGMYADDPLGKIGYLSASLFRAARLVVDTGLHSRGWSRDQAHRYLVENSSDSVASAQTEIDRYIVYPGQATAYMMGKMAIVRMRTEAERHALYDIRRFHDLVLSGGPMPLSVLERRVHAGIAGWGNSAALS